MSILTLITSNSQAVTQKLFYTLASHGMANDPKLAKQTRCQSYNFGQEHELAGEAFMSTNAEIYGSRYINHVFFTPSLDETAEIKPHLRTAFLPRYQNPYDNFDYVLGIMDTGADKEGRYFSWEEKPALTGNINDVEPGSLSIGLYSRNIVELWTGVLLPYIIRINTHLRPRP